MNARYYANAIISKFFLPSFVPPLHTPLPLSSSSSVSFWNSTSAENGTTIIKWITISIRTNYAPFQNPISIIKFKLSNIDELGCTNLILSGLKVQLKFIWICDFKHKLFPLYKTDYWIQPTLCMMIGITFNCLTQPPRLNDIWCYLPTVYLANGLFTHLVNSS